MTVAVTSIVVFEVPDDGTPIEELRQKFFEAHRVFIGQQMKTVTGQAYVLRAIEFLDVVKRR